VDVTTPNVPSISGRVVKGLGLMLAAIFGRFPASGVFWVSSCVATLMP
jgi:hypothetical protein